MSISRYLSVFADYLTSAGVLNITGGGTGATSASAALTNLGAFPTAGGTLTGALTSNTGAESVIVVGPSGVTSVTGTSALGLTVKGATSTTDLSGINFKSTGSANPTARIAVVSSGGGSTMYLGTSNNYTSGITSNTSIDYSGNLTAAGNVTAYSDERLKTNWRNVPATFISDMAQVKNGIYDRIDTGITQVGVSAQSLQTVLPDAVLEQDGQLSVAYGNAALLSVVEICKELVALREEIKQLKERPTCKCGCEGA